MDVFKDIYKLFTRKYISESGWSETDIKELEGLLDQLSPQFENGDLLVNAWKREIRDHFEELNISFQHIIEDLFKVDEIINKKSIDNSTDKGIKVLDDEIDNQKQDKDQEDIWQGLFPKDQILAKYNSVYVYKPIVDEIMNDDNLPSVFNHNDVQNILIKYYKNVLKKKINNKSIKIYANKYIKYLKENKLIFGTEAKFVYKKKDESDVIINTCYDEKEKIEEPTIDPLAITPPVIADAKTLDKAKAIYDHAVEHKWLGVPRTTLDTIEKTFFNFTSDEIRSAISVLIQQDKVFQTNPDYVKFLYVK